MLEYISNYVLDLSEPREIFELSINSRNLWITASPKGRHGVVKLKFGSSYTDSDEISASIGFNMVNSFPIDKLYISNDSQPGKYLVINYSNTTYFNPRTLRDYSSTPVLIPSKGEFLSAENGPIPAAGSPVKIFSANPNRVWAQIVCIERSSLILFKNTTDILFYQKQSLDASLYYSLNTYPQSFTYKGDIYAASINRDIAQGFVKMIEFTTV